MCTREIAEIDGVERRTGKEDRREGKRGEEAKMMLGCRFDDIERTRFFVYGRSESAKRGARFQPHVVICCCCSSHALDLSRGSMIVVVHKPKRQEPDRK